jgi:hypothetical protein
MLIIVNKKTWRTCDFPVWERVKHIVPVYNAHLSYTIKNIGWLAIALAFTVVCRLLIREITLVNAYDI